MMLACKVAPTLAAVVFLTASSVLSAQSLDEQLHSLLSDLQAEYGFPGATVAVASGNGEVVSVAVGLADVEAHQPMTTDTRMLAASIGKTFAATTVLALAAEDRLSLDDRVSRYLGAREWFSRLPNHESMTIAHLLKHTAGLPDHVHTEAFARNMALRVVDGSDAPRAEATIAFVLDAEPMFPAGTSWAYTDTGYLLLGLIIEEVADRSYYEEITARFLEPLRLTDTAPSTERCLPNLAVGYTVPDGPFGIPARTMDSTGCLRWDPAVEWTGGGLVSTSRDLAVWGHALFTGTAMNKPYLESLLDGVAVDPDSPDQRYGAGIAIRTATPRGSVFGHGGWIPGYVSSLRHYADHKVTVAFQVNTDVGVVDDASDLVPRLENALGDLVIGLCSVDNRQ